MKLFSRSLTDTDCLKRLYIPKWVLTYLPDFHGGHAIKLQVSCETRQWSIGCTIRKKGYEKPVLSRGWRKFVVDNSLDVGDELTLHREEDETGSLHYRVEVIKRATSGPSKATRRNKVMKKKKQKVVNCSHQTSDHQFESPVDGIASATDETNNSLPKHVDGVEEPEKRLKLFGAILRGAVVVGAGETVDPTAYHNSFKRFGLTVGDAELVNRNDVQASLKSDHYGAKEETAATLEHFRLGAVTADAGRNNYAFQS